MAKMEKSYPHQAVGPHNKLNIVLLGVGGTGGQVLAQLAKIKALGIDNARISDFDLTLVDGDEVEAKNCTRQNFFEMDIGSNKAEILAERYSEAYGTDIGFVDHYIEDNAELRQIVVKDGMVPVIVGCVDNHKTRQMVDRLFDSHRGIFWIDSGNEEFGGQVVCGYNYSHAGRRLIRQVGQDINARMRHQRDMMKGKFFDLPCVTEVYPEIGLRKDVKFNSELSCAERAESAPQNIIVNSMAAQLVMMFVRKILTGEEITSHCVTYSIKTMNTRTMFNKNAVIKEVMQKYDEALAAPAPEAEAVVDEQPIEE